MVLANISRLSTSMSTHTNHNMVKVFFFNNTVIILHGWIYSHSISSFTRYISINLNSISCSCLLSVLKQSTLACGCESHFCHLLVLINYMASI